MKSKRKSRRKPPKTKRDQKRQIGFLCAWCLPGTPYNEWFVPAFYRAAIEHQRDALMCWACHLEGAGGNGSTKRSNKTRPLLNAETLEAFWREDNSNGSAVRAATRYFQVRERTIVELRDQIRV